MIPRRHISRPRILWMTALVFICGQGLAVADTFISQLFSDPIAAQLRARIEAVDAPTAIDVQGATLHASALLAQLYRDRAFQPLWIAADGPQPHVETFLKVMRGADREGLDPAHYHLQHIEGILGRGDPSHGRMQAHERHALVDVELLLTDALITYVWHLRAGRIAPERINEVGSVDLTAADLLALVQQTLAASHFEDALQHLPPAQAGYTRLRQAVMTYQAIAARGGWPKIPDGPKLQQGDRGSRVVALRNRLLITGDLEQNPLSGGDLFDVALERGLRRFQARHGLEPDGVVGAATLAALNVPVEARLRQLTLNMERWRWLPVDFGERHIAVNIPNFTLEVVDRGQAVLNMGVVVGRPDRPTPLFSADMTYLVLSPHWYVPPTIAMEDMLPLLRKDPSYAARQNLRIFHDAGSGSTLIDPMSVNWSAVSARHFPYRLRQDPGPKNSLGSVKFMFPNRYHVYLHDTPSKKLFAKTERAYSSGCIRVAKPLELAEYLLGADSQWSRQKILAAIAASREQTVRLPTSIPVHLLYLTAWINEDGVIHFRKDLYGRDAIMARALQEALPNLPSEEYRYAVLSGS
jgi:murein L,D-transpeptidase YcbB/YkuD